MFKKKEKDHATPLLQRLHWLPVRERINYKIAVMVFKYFQGTTPSYISTLLQPPPKHQHQTRLSQDKTFLNKRTTKTSSFGGKSFQYYGPLVWNSLPREIRELRDEDGFKKALKTYMFSKTYL